MSSEIKINQGVEPVFVDYEDALEHARNAVPPFNKRSATNTWAFLTARCLGSREVAQIGDINLPKSNAFRRNFIIDMANIVSKQLTDPNFSYSGLPVSSARFLVDLANNGLRAEPPVPQINR